MLNRLAEVEAKYGWPVLPAQRDSTLSVAGLYVPCGAILGELHHLPLTTWRSQPAGAVYGCSLTYNPAHPREQWASGSFGHPRYQRFSAVDYFSKPEEDLATCDRDDYLDGLGFTELLPELDNCPALTALLRSFQHPVVRATLRIVDGTKAHPAIDEEGGMHKDEDPTKLLRLNICLSTNEHFGLQYRGEDPLRMCAGQNLVVNTDRDHRSWVGARSPLQRAHIILCLATWLRRGGDRWVPNEHFGVTHPYDLVRSNRILKKG